MKLAIENSAITRRIGELATRIDADYQHVGKPHLIGVLPEGYQLIRDVSRALATDHTLDFVIEQREPVFPLTTRKHIKNGLKKSTHDKHVLVVTLQLRDERVIYDTYSAILTEENPRTIRLLALLQFVDESGMNPSPNYVGYVFKGHPHFFGYGMEPQAYLPDIYKHTTNGKRKSTGNFNKQEPQTSPETTTKPASRQKTNKEKRTIQREKRTTHPDNGKQRNRKKTQRISKNRESTPK